MGVDMPFATYIMDCFLKRSDEDNVVIDQFTGQIFSLHTGVVLYTESKKSSNSKPSWHHIYNQNSRTKNGLKTDCSSLSTC